VTVAVGDAVIFVNTGTENHDIVLTNGVVAPLLHPGESYSLVMTTAGQISYKETGFTQTYKGRIVVNPGSTGQISLASPAPFIAYGGQVALSGHANLAAGGTVILSSHAAAGVHASRRCGGRTSSTAAASGWTSTAGPLGLSSTGTFAFVVRPTRATTYRVESGDGQVCSTALTVQVRPLVTLRASSHRVKTGRSVTLYARVQPAAASTALVLSRLEAASGWRKVTTAQTSPNGTARFTFVAPQGKTRLHLSTSAHGGSRGNYLAATGNAVEITGVGSGPATAHATKHAAKHHRKKH
jgi:hypothetical protein